MTTDTHDTTTAAPESAALNDRERREALRKLGTLAALTPPTVLTLLLSRRASADSLGLPPEDGGEDP